MGVSITVSQCLEDAILNFSRLFRRNGFIVEVSPTKAIARYDDCEITLTHNLECIYAPIISLGAFEITIQPGGKTYQLALIDRCNTPPQSVNKFKFDNPSDIELWEQERKTNTEEWLKLYETAPIIHIGCASVSKYDIGRYGSIMNLGEWVHSRFVRK